MRLEGLEFNHSCITDGRNFTVVLKWRSDQQAGDARGGSCTLSNQSFISWMGGIPRWEQSGLQWSIQREVKDATVWKQRETNPKRHLEEIQSDPIASYNIYLLQEPFFFPPCLNVPSSISHLIRQILFIVTTFELGVVKKFLVCSRCFSLLLTINSFNTIWMNHSRNQGKQMCKQ